MLVRIKYNSAHKSGVTRFITEEWSMLILRNEGKEIKISLDFVTATGNTRSYTFNMQYTEYKYLKDILFEYEGEYDKLELLVGADLVSVIR